MSLASVKRLLTYLGEALPLALEGDSDAAGVPDCRGEDSSSRSARASFSLAILSSSSAFSFSMTFLDTQNMYHACQRVGQNAIMEAVKLWFSMIDKQAANRMPVMFCY